MTTREEYLNIELLEAAKDIVNIASWQDHCDCDSCTKYQRLNDAVDALDEHRMAQLESDDGR